MGIQLNSGIMMINNTEMCSIELPTIESNATEEVDNPVVAMFNPCMDAEFSISTDCINAELLSEIAQNNLYPFVAEFNAPILVQARWHKKWRTRKKWLKRYGMKKDTIQVKGMIESIAEIPQEPTIGYCETGLIGTFSGYEYTFKEISFVFNEYQMRKGMMMEVL